MVFEAKRKEVDHSASFDVDLGDGIVLLEGDPCLLRVIVNGERLRLEVLGSRSVRSCATGGNVITFAGMSSSATEEASPSVQVCVTSFRRGDSNADGRVDISDAIFTLTFLYLGGAATPCLAAADANDDGAVDISDGILVLDRLFIAGPAAVIRPPGIHNCGPESRSDGLGCASYPSC